MAPDPRQQASRLDRIKEPALAPFPRPGFLTPDDRPYATPREATNPNAGPAGGAVNPLVLAAAIGANPAQLASVNAAYQAGTAYDGAPGVPGSPSYQPTPAPRQPNPLVLATVMGTLPNSGAPGSTVVSPPPSTPYRANPTDETRRTSWHRSSTEASRACAAASNRLSATDRPVQRSCSW